MSTVTFLVANVLTAICRVSHLAGPSDLVFPAWPDLLPDSGLRRKPLPILGPGDFEAPHLPGGHLQLRR